MDDSNPTLCFRCGYDLRGTADDQPCPECGLLAGRSRRPTDALRDARPRWLRNLALGVTLMLVSLLAILLWPMVCSFVFDAITDHYRKVNGAQMPTIYRIEEMVSIGGEALAVVVFAFGVISFTQPEGYAPADRKDSWRRWLIRFFVMLPVVGMTYFLWCVFTQSGWTRSEPDWIGFAILFLFTIGLAPLPALVFVQFKSLARRAKSAHLMEHCTIVGVGTTLTFVAVFTVYLIQEFGKGWGIDLDMARSSPWAILAPCLMMTAVLLFWLWSIYLTVRFAISFWRAAGEAKRAWLASDRAANC